MLTVRRLVRPGLKPSDLDLAAGECVGLSGPSGAGKSLLLRAIADLDVNHGDLALEGTARDAMPAPLWRRLVAYVPAESGWWAETVGGHFDGADPAPLFSALGLADAVLAWQVARLSTGERQRLALARALLRTPKVLLLDEPTSGLDPQAAERVEAELKRRLDAGNAILVVTHDPAQAERLAGRRLRMEDGRLQADPAEAPA